MNSSGITITRISDPALAAPLASLGRDTFVETFGSAYKPENLAAFLSDAYSEESYADIIARSDHALWAAQSAEGALIGYALASPCFLPVENMHDNAGELRRLYVRREWQSAKIGGQLMGLAMSWLCAQFDHLYLGVYSQNAGAIRFYERHGFAKIGDYHFMVGDEADHEFIFYRAAA